MAYEVFKRSAVRVDTPVLSMTPNGKVAFNAAACRLLEEAKMKTAVILWDEVTNRMAVKAAPKGERNAFGISFTGGNSASLTAKSFIRHIGWKAPKREALATTWNAAEKMFEATLPSRYVASSPAHGKRKAEI